MILRINLWIQSSYKKTGETKMGKLILILSYLVIALNAQAQIVDEIIVDSQQTGKAWDSETSQNHEIWQRPTCSAFTMSEDGQSTLEVVAYYDLNTDLFSEPEVNVVTQANFSFLDVVVRTDGSSQQFQLLPIQPQNTNLVGARVLFDDREGLVSAIRRYNNLTSRYLDSSGEVKSIRFSLRGSSDAIAAQFSHCGLEFLPELDLPNLVNL